MQAPKSGVGGGVNVNDKNVRKSNKAQAHNQGDANIKQGVGMQAPKSGVGGTVKVNDKNVRKSNKAQANNTGDISIASQQSRMQPPKHDNYVVVDNSRQRKQSKQVAKYQGDMAPMESHMQGPKNSGALVLERGVNHKTMKQISKYSGDLPPNYLNKRADMRASKNAQVSGYKGSISVRTLEQRAKKIRKKNKQIANYKGDIIVHKRKEGMHPSSVYRGGRVKNSYEAKEKYRKKMLKKYGKNEDIETPNYMKKKDSRPKYDKRESDIWY